MSDWTCPHGLGGDRVRGSCRDCNAELAARPEPESMSGDDRAEEVRALLNEPSAYAMHDIHRRIEALVGRPVWTHEFATAGNARLLDEARGAPHPADLRQHAIDSLRAVAGDKPIIVVEPD